jgi:hypothetical protein
LILCAESVAAALFYGISSGHTGTALVYDLGGGTFAATIVRLTETRPIVVAVDGSNELGGLNFDERLQDLLIERYVLATSDESAADDDLSDRWLQPFWAAGLLLIEQYSNRACNSGLTPRSRSLLRSDRRRELARPAS